MSPRVPPTQTMVAQYQQTAPFLKTVDVTNKTLVITIFDSICNFAQTHDNGLTPTVNKTKCLIFSGHVYLFSGHCLTPDKAEKTYAEVVGCACLQNCQNLVQQIVNNALPISRRHDCGQWDRVPDTASKQVQDLLHSIPHLVYPSNGAQHLHMCIRNFKCNACEECQ